ncbi:MAG: rod shape-determining protein RodA [Parcubacteria group bacterium]|jgi:rod shape determining protein RodA
MKNFLKFDWIAIAVIFLLVAIGLTALYSVSTVEGVLNLNDFWKQSVALLLGAGLAVALAHLDYRVLNANSTKLYFIALALLTAVLLIGKRIRGAQAWIDLGYFHLEPVEIVKLVMIIFLASFLAKKKTELSMLWRVIGSIVLVFIPVFLIIKQPDFGSASVIVGIWGGMLVASGLNKKTIFVLLLIGIVGATSGWFFLKNYQKERIINFIEPANDPLGTGYNVIQSTIAVGSGGMFGKGLGHGSQSQLNFLPEKHTDFIFAVIAEELGLFGAALVLGLYVALLFRIRETARLARDNFGYLLCVGVIVMLFVQLFVNVGMNIGVVPVAGVPLSFLSYGGSSLLAILASMGLIQSVYMRRLKTLD